MIRKSKILVVLIALLMPRVSFAQQNNYGSVIGTQCSFVGSTAMCSPAQLGINALSEPGSSTSALSAIIDTRGAMEATLKFSCTQGTITVNVQTYAEDGTTVLALISPISAVAAATQTDMYLGSESNPSASGGTISGTAIVRMPQRALSFSFTNANVTTGTCTARLFLNY